MSKNLRKQKPMISTVAKLAAAKAAAKVAKTVTSKKSRPRSGKKKGAFTTFAEGGRQVGKLAGNLIGLGIDKIWGSGDYVVSGSTPASNTLLSSPYGVPAMHSTTDSYRVFKREYIADVSTQTGLVVNVYPINPGLASLFPWLSGIASVFQEYTIHGMAFEYKSTCANAVASTNSAMGSVIMGVVYDSDEPPPSTKSGLLNLSWANDARPSENFLTFVECDKSQSPFETLYIRTGNLSSNNTDYNTHDFGRLVLASVGAQTSFSCGELWVTYDIELKKPIPASVAQGNTQYVPNFHFNSLYSNARPLTGAGAVSVRNNGLSAQVFANAASQDTILLPNPSNGFYELSISWDNSGSVSVTYPSVTQGQTNSGSPLLVNATYNGYRTPTAAGVFLLQSPPSASTTTSCIAKYLFQVTGATGSIQSSIFFTVGAGGTLPSGASSVVDCMLTYLGASFV